MSFYLYLLMYFWLIIITYKDMLIYLNSFQTLKNEVDIV